MVTIAHDSTRDDLAECLTHFAKVAARMLRRTPLGEENAEWAAKQAEINELLTAWEMLP